MSSTWLITPVSASLTLTVPRRSRDEHVAVRRELDGGGRCEARGHLLGVEAGGHLDADRRAAEVLVEVLQGCPVTKASSKRASCSADSSLLTSARSDSQALVIPPGMGRSGPATISALPGFMLVLKLTLYIPPGCGLTIR